jgi:predicted DNA-binding protein YlxM (UPF0122 family)
MRELCRNCEKHSTCTKPCEALLKETEEVDEQNFKEISVRNFDLSSEGSEGEDREASLVNEYYRERQVYAPSDSQAGGLGDNTFAPAFEISGDVWQSLKEIIDKAISPRAPKQRSRFYAFIKGKKMSEIAKQANTSKQNIHKQFERIIKRAIQIYHKDRSWKAEKITPHKFTRKLEVTKYD